MSEAIEQYDQDKPRIGGIKGYFRLAFRFLPYPLKYWDKALLRLLYRFVYSVVSVLAVMAMTRLVDELVQIDEGIYLGQLVFATRHYSLGNLRLPFCPDLPEIPVGEPYSPDKKHPLHFLLKLFSDLKLITASLARLHLGEVSPWVSPLAALAMTKYC